MAGKVQSGGSGLLGRKGPESHSPGLSIFRTRPLAPLAPSGSRGLLSRAVARPDSSGLSAMRHQPAPSPRPPVPPSLWPVGSWGLLAEASERARRKCVAWNRARPVPGRDARTWRLDDYGRPIRFDDYGDRGSVYGWEVDHIIPLACARRARQRRSPGASGPITLSSQTGGGPESPPAYPPFLIPQPQPGLKNVPGHEGFVRAISRWPECRSD